MTDNARETRSSWPVPLIGVVMLAALLAASPVPADPIFESAFGSLTVRDMLAGGRYAEVRNLAEQRLAVAPDDGDMYAVLSYAQAGLGEWLEAEKSVQSAIELVDPASREDLRVLHAEILLGLGKPGEAERELRTVLSNRPDHVSALLEMGVLYRRTGDGVRSLEYFERVLDVDPGQETALRVLFESYLTNADYASIRRLARAIPTESEARWLGLYFGALADVRLDPPDYEAAAGKLEQALLERGPVREVFATLGWVRYRQQDLGAAAAALARAVELSPEDFESQRLLGAVLLEANEPNLAAGHLEQALAIRDTVELRRLLARAYLVLGRNEDMAEQMLAVAESGDTLAGRDNTGVQGLYQYVSGNFEQSEEALRRGLAERPEASHLRFLLISSLLKQERFAAAVREAQQAVRDYPDEKVLALNFLALAKLGEGEYDEAEAVLGEALTIDPAARTTRVNLSTVYFRTGRYGSAERELQTILAANPDEPGIRIRLSRVLQAAEDYDRAEAVLREAAGDGGPTRQQMRELFLLQLRAGDGRAALDTANAMVAAAPTLFESYLLRAQALASLGRAMEARDAIDRGFAATGETAGALATAASLARVQGWHEQAVEYLERQEARFGIDDPTLLKLYAVELIEVGETEKARRVLTAGLDRTDPDAIFLTARSFIADGNRAEAERYIDAALAAGIDPAVIDEQRGELATALQLERLREDIAENDDEPAGYLTLAETHELLGDLDAAIAVYRGGLGRTESDDLFLVQIARLQLKQGETDAAIDTAQALLESQGVADDIRFRAWSVIGLARLTRGEAASAERALEAATAAGSDVAAAHFRLANIRLDKGETDEAIRLLSRAIEIEPTNLTYHLALAGAYKKAGDTAASIVAYEAGLAAIENSVPLLNDLALTYLALDRTDEARETAQRALELAPGNARVLNTMGQVYLRARDPRAAIPYLERAVDGAPQSSLYRFHLGVSYLETGSVDLARTELEESLAREADAPWAGEIRRVLEAIGES